MHFWWVCHHCWATPITKTFNLLEHRFPQVPVRQWVVTMPKRLRYFLLSNSQLTGRVLEIGLRVVIERTLKEHCPDASLTENTAASLISIVLAQRVMPICCACFSTRPAEFWLVGTNANLGKQQRIFPACQGKDSGKWPRRPREIISLLRSADLYWRVTELAGKSWVACFSFV